MAYDGYKKLSGGLPTGLSGYNPPTLTDTARLKHKKYSTDNFSFPLDVDGPPGTGNQGHYIMFFVNQQSNTKLGFGSNDTKSDGKANMDKDAAARKIPTYLKKLTSGNKQTHENIRNAYGIKNQSNKDALANYDDAAFISSKSRGSTITIDRPATVRMSTAITMYMPQMVAVGYAADYQDKEVGDATQQGIKMFQDIANKGKMSEGEIKEAIGKLGTNLGEGMVNKGIGLLSAIPGIEGAKEVMFAQRGFIKAPKMELFFNGIGKRKFSYSFKMMPKSYEEMQQIRLIVASFKLNMLPEFVDGDRASRRLTVPNTFDIQYMYNGAENDYLHKISTCVLESLDVSYSGEGKYQTFTADVDGAPPMVTTLTLDFQEMEIITKERVAEGY